MPHYTYLTVGAGMAADGAVKGIRRSTSTVPSILSDRSHTHPMPVPPVEKALAGEAAENIWRGTEDLA